MRRAARAQRGGKRGNRLTSLPRALFGFPPKIVLHPRAAGQETALGPGLPLGWSGGRALVVRWGGALLRWMPEI